mgnify:FL=1|jgi:hypothetical protein|tara:strand:+ start:60 stop:809 length:750 start_codon:yes stop_codon:yes gene_type:complete
MSLFYNNLLLGASGQGGGGPFYDYQIEQSIRIGSGDTLRRTPGSDGNITVWTFSAWIKRSEITSSQYQILESGASGAHATRLFYFFNVGAIGASSSDVNFGASTETFRDTSAWMHLVLKHTGGVTTAYRNGTSFHTWSISGDTAINKSGLVHGIGCRGGSGSGSEIDSYMAEVILVDGTAHEPTQFAESKNDVWIPKDPSGTSFGTNGVHLKFENASDLGNDSSGNNNDYTTGGIDATNQVLDSPTFGE